MSFTANFTKVYKHVITFFSGDKAIALSAIKPFYCTRFTI